MKLEKGVQEIKKMARIIALSNQKGGVGKTTTSMNLSTALAACGHRVLVVDLDPQGNTTTGFGIDKETCGKSAYTLLIGESSPLEAIQHTDIKGLDVVPSTIDLTGAEIELVSAMAREYRLKNALAQVEDQYDYIFIDCPPSLGLLTINALTAVQEIIIPLQCEFYAMEGLSQLFQTIELIKKSLNPDLKLLGVLLTMFDSRNKLSSLVEEDVRKHLGTQVLNTVIPRNVKVSEAPSHGKPALLYDVNCRGSQAYIKLAAEVMKSTTQKGAVA